MKKIITAIAAATVCCAALVFAEDAAPATQKTESDWCIIEVPMTTQIGDVIPVKVTLKEIAEGLKFRGDLHGMSLSGMYKGMLKYGGKAQDVVSGQTVTLHLPVPAKEGVATVHFTAYLSPDGEWANKVGDKAVSAPMPIIE